MEKYVTSILAFLSQLTPFTAYSIILGVLLACGFGLPIPEDITLIVAGFLAGMGKISLIGSLLAGFSGVLIGDSILFMMGKRYGRAVFHWPLFKKLFTPERISMAEEKIQKNAHIICFTSRFLPGLRAPIYLTAGIMGVRPTIFLMQDGLAALVSVPIWIWVGHLAGSNASEDNVAMALKWAGEVKIYLFSGLGLILLGYFVKKFFKKS